MRLSEPNYRTKLASLLTTLTILTSTTTTNATKEYTDRQMALLPVARCTSKTLSPTPGVTRPG